MQIVTVTAGIQQGTTINPAGTTLTIDANLDADRAVYLVEHGDATFVDAKNTAALALLNNVKTQSPGVWIPAVAASWPDLSHVEAPPDSPESGPSRRTLFTTPKGPTDMGKKTGIILDQASVIDGKRHVKGEFLELEERAEAALTSAGTARYADGRGAATRMVDGDDHPIRAFNVGPRPVDRPK